MRPAQVPVENDIVNETLRFIAQRGWQASDRGFFDDLVLYLSQTLDVACVFVGRLMPEKDDTVRSIAMSMRGEIVDDIEYGLAGTPCEDVVGQSLCCHVDRVQELFPDDEMLVEMGAASYVGLPLWAGDGRPLGLIALVDEKPLTHPELIETLLQIVCLRASAELERQILDAELQASHARFRDFAAASSDWFWEMDQDLRFTWLSPEIEHATGNPPEWFYGKTREEVGAPDIQTEKWRAHLEAMRQHKPFKDFVYERHTRDGVRWLCISGVPVFDDDGHFRGYRGSGTDMTATVEAQRQVEQEQARFKDAVEGMSDGIALFDQDDRLLFCNAKFHALNPGLSPRIAPGISFETLLRDNLDEGRVLDAQGQEDRFFRERMERHRNPTEPLLTQRSDGRWLLARDERLADSSTLLINTDLTEIKQNEEALRESEAKLSQSQKIQAIGKLTGGIAHDFNNLLAVIMGNAELLQFQSGHDEKRLAAILHATKRGAELVQRLLSFSRKQPLDPQHVDLGALVSDMSGLIARSLGEKSRWR